MQKNNHNQLLSNECCNRPVCNNKSLRLNLIQIFKNSEDCGITDDQDEESIACKWIEKRLPEYHQGNLSDNELDVLEGHIMECDRCRQKEAQLFLERLEKLETETAEKADDKQSCLGWKRWNRRRLAAVAACLAAVFAMAGTYCYQTIQEKSQSELSALASYTEGTPKEGIVPERTNTYIIPEPSEAVLNYLNQPLLAEVNREIQFKQAMIKAEKLVSDYFQPDGSPVASEQLFSSYTINKPSDFTRAVLSNVSDREPLSNTQIAGISLSILADNLKKQKTNLPPEKRKHVIAATAALLANPLNEEPEYRSLYVDLNSFGKLFWN